MKPTVRSTKQDEFACVVCGEHWFRYDHLTPEPKFFTRWFCTECGSSNELRVIDGCFDVSNNPAETGPKKKGPPGMSKFPVLIEHWDDLGFTAVLQLINPSVLGVRLWAIAGKSDEGVRYYGTLSDNFPKDSYKVCETVDGFIKWDGCSNWNTMPDGVMQHFCDDSFLNAGKAMRRAYARAAKILENWDGGEVKED